MSRFRGLNFWYRVAMSDERRVTTGVVDAWRSGDLRERAAVLEVRSADLLAAPGLEVPFLVRQDRDEAGKEEFGLEGHVAVATAKGQQGGEKLTSQRFPLSSSAGAFDVAQGIGGIGDKPQTRPGAFFAKTIQGT